ncbi:uncharacterized protein N7484_000462 [Penicillium longicatenatum]|uniref:uncharacterized protein n=1 Tax=Penicillium longicatenatum TaxID=1561947 RepID=UPI00254712B5|nr:uncharacterized protein N7484_000462 [Penicillium longicatenatum]KAJ5661090.1 hypothetical protein N7484_000462 [Penicillium longicatenatum]
MLLRYYAGYLDDFRDAIATWNSIWGSMTCSYNVKMLMQLSYEYLRLYANEFAFQAATLRTLAPNSLALDDEARPIKSLGGLPEARFTFESIDAARSLLTLVNNIPLEKNLSIFPIRLPLPELMTVLRYCVNAAVFLFKIWNIKVISNAERASIRQLIGDTIESLQKGTQRPSQLGLRYALLLKMLWERANHRPGMSDDSLDFECRTKSATQSQETQEGFSWLDLEAIGDFVWGDSTLNGGIDPGNANQQPDLLREDFDWNDMHMLAGNDFSWIF